LNFNILQKPPPKDDERGWYRWFYRVAEILNEPATPYIKGEYADNAAALTAGLVAGQFYRTSTGAVMVVY